MSGSDSLSRTDSMHNDIEKEKLEKTSSVKRRYRNGGTDQSEVMITIRLPRANLDDRMLEVSLIIGR